MKNVLIRMFNAFVLVLFLVELIGYAIVENPRFKRAPFPSPSPQEIVRENDPTPPIRPFAGTEGADSDGDGMPDTWELAHFLNPNSAADAGSDFDGDGITAKQEYTVDTNPQGNWTFQSVPLNDLTGTIDASIAAPIQVIDVNNSGSVVLRIQMVNPETSEVSKTSWFYSSAAGLTQIAPEATDYDVEVFDVNDSGVAVGRMISKLDGTLKGFIWQNGTTSDLTTPDGNPAAAKRINNQGNWVGFEWNASTSWWTPVAVIDGQVWRNEYDLALDMPTSALFGGLPVLDILGINESDQVLAVYNDYWNWNTALAVAWKGHIESACFPFPRLDSPSPADYNEAIINNNGEYAAHYLFFDGASHSLSGYQISGVTDDGMVVESNPGSSASVMAWADDVEVPIGEALLNGATVRSAAISSNGILAASDGITPEIRILTKNQDRDGDGMSDDWETFYGFNPNNASDAFQDSDGDGLSNLGEFLLNSDPSHPPAIDPNGNQIDTRPGIDTDGDGIPNIWEWSHGLNYLDASDASLDFDRDGFTNLQEFQLNTDPCGAPSYRIREIGPFPGAATVSLPQMVLGSAMSSGAAVSSNGGNLVESVQIQGGPTSSPSLHAPATWSEPRASISGSFSFNPLGGTQPLEILTQSLSGATLARQGAISSRFIYWASPASQPITLSGAANANNARSLARAKLSPSGNYLAAARTQQSTTNTELVVWKMPVGSQRFAPVKLTPPTGVWVSNYTELFVNDAGYVTANGSYGSSNCGILWSINASGNAVSSVVLPPLEGGSWAKVCGISNTANPIVAGTSEIEGGQTRAAAWSTSGIASNLGTLGGSSSLNLVSPGGLVAGTSVGFVGESLQPQVFVGKRHYNPTTNETFWNLQSQGEAGADSKLTSINDAGELLGQISVPGGQAPILWRNGRSYPLGSILPPNSGYTLSSVTALNNGGTLLASAMKNGYSVNILLTPDRDTDGDGLPDAYENEHQFSPYLSQVPGTDSDSDGLSDFDEYRNGTDPRKPDSDGDGMSDGWEVQWGLLPLDGSDANLDPDNDRVSNLREYQIGTNPTGLYRLEVVPLADNRIFNSAADDGSIIVKNEPQDSTERNYDLVRTSNSQGIRSITALPSDLWNETFDEQSGNSLLTVRYMNYSINEGGIAPCEVYNGNFESNIDGDTLESSYGFSLLEDSATNPANYISHANIANQLVAGGIFSEGDELLGSSIPSSNGLYRIFDSTVGKIILNGHGDFVAHLSNDDWIAINNQGQALRLAMRNVDATSEVPEHLEWDVIVSDGSSVQVKTLPVVGSTYMPIFRSFSDDSVVLISQYVTTPDGGRKTEDYTLEMATGAWTKVRRPGVGIESTLSLSNRTGRMVGSGPKPFQITPDGTCILLDALRIESQGGTSAPFSSLHSAPIVPNHVTSDGRITVTTTDSSNQQVILQIIPANDTNNNGIADDWELSEIKYLTEENMQQWGYLLVSKTLDPNTAYWGTSRTALHSFQLGLSHDSLKPSKKSDFDHDGISDAEDAVPWDGLVSWQRAPESGYALIELQVPPDAGPAVDLNDKGEVLFTSAFGNEHTHELVQAAGIWAAGNWIPIASPITAGADPQGNTFDAYNQMWTRFNQNRQLLGHAHLIFNDASQPAGGDGLVSPSLWPTAQSTPSLLLETANLWDNPYSSFTPIGVSNNGNLIVRARRLDGTQTLERYDPSGTLIARMDGTQDFHPSGGWGHGDSTNTGWFASNLTREATQSQSAAHKVALWDASNNPVTLPANANGWGYPVSVRDLPNNKIALTAGQWNGENYTGRVFLKNPTTGQFEYADKLADKEIELFAGDGTALTNDGKLWRNGEVVPMADLCPRYKELLEEGSSIHATRSNRNGAYLVQVDSPSGVTSSALLIPIDVISDVNHDGDVDYLDEWLRDAALEPGAPAPVVENGTQYLLANDPMSNGKWDVEDITGNWAYAYPQYSSMKPAPVGVGDDDAKLIKITINGLKSGVAWFEHPSINQLEFFNAKRCAPSDKINITANSPFDLSSGLPRNLYVRLKSEFDSDTVAGSLTLLVGSDTANVWGRASMPLTLVKGLGGAKFFEAARAYILENNTKCFVSDYLLPNKSNPQSRFRLCIMREEATELAPIDAYADGTKGILPSVWSGSGRRVELPTVAVNGNQCFFSAGYEESIGDLTHTIKQIADRCQGRVIVGSTVKAISSDNFDESTKPAKGSVLAGPDPIPVGNIAGNDGITGTPDDIPNPHAGEAGGKFLGYNSGSWNFEAGVAHGNMAVGGLSTNYNSAFRQDVAHQMVGFIPGFETGKGCVFTATQIIGTGYARDFALAASLSGNPSLAPSTDPNAQKLLILDSGGGSIALVHPDGDGNTVPVYIGRKSMLGVPYYVNNYLEFYSKLPRP